MRKRKKTIKCCQFHICLLAEQRVGGVESSDLPCLVSGQNSNLPYNDMADIRRQSISFDGDNELFLKNNIYDETKLEEG